MRPLFEQLNHYAAQRTKPNAKIADYMGIPCLLFGLLILFGWVHLSVPDLFGLNLAWLGVIALLIYYYRLDLFLAGVMTVVLLVLTILANLVSQPAISKTNFLICVFFLVIGIGAQLLKRFFEGRPLLALPNWCELLIAPLFIVAEVSCRFGLRQDLQEIFKKNQPL